MLLKSTAIDEFAQEVKQTDDKIIIYGAGVIGKEIVPYIMQEYDLSGRVLFFVDADSDKQGKRVIVGENEVEILDLGYLNRITENFVILITASRYEGVLSYLNRCTYLDNVKGYLLPQMLAKEAASSDKYKNIRKTSAPVIPKKIHYCWFGGGKIPEVLQACIDSWKRFCPDYEIIQWNESNYDYDKYPYTRQAFRNQKWAFVSDVARLDILYQHGGIYLDTDVELIRNLDELLYQPGFCGVEKWRLINTGGGCGAVYGHPVIEMMLEKRKYCVFEYPNGKLNLESSGSYETRPLLERGFLPDNRVQVISNMTIYSSDFFHPYDYMTKKLCITENTVGIHHFIGSWL